MDDSLHLARTYDEDNDQRSLIAALLGATDMVIALFTADGVLVEAGRGCERALGRPLETLRGRRYWETFVAPTEHEPARLWFEALVSSGQSRRDALEWTASDGRKRRLRISSSVLEADGRDPQVLLAGADVTDELRARDELAERAARLRAVFETAVDGIVVIDTEGTIESVNRAAERIFGHRSGDLVGRDIGVLMPADHASAHAGYVERYLETGEARIIGVGREVEAQRRDGSRFPAELAISEVRLPGRRSFVGIVRDITRRRRAEEQAHVRLDEMAHASRLLELGEMTSGIAHEVNQPLTAIVSFAEACARLIESKNADEELLSGALDQIISQGQRAAEIIDRMRRFVRKGGGDRQRLALGPVLDEVLELLAHEVRRAHAEVALEVEDDLPAVLADRVQIEQVVVNLVRNACDALDGSAGAHRIGLIARRAGGDIEVTVADTGPGLAADAREHLFEAFYTTKAEGMGVGLSISRSIIDAHGGRLWVEPAAEGGTVFRFTLPCCGDDDGI